MAIYHLSIKIISRGKGKSAVAAAAYRAGERIKSEHDGLTHDYTRKGGVVHTEIVLPDNAPAEYADRAILWNAVEKFERYKTAQLAREIELALPVELSRAQRISLVREYVIRHFVAAGMCADICVHDKSDGNPHAHILLTMRPIGRGDKWGMKSRTEGGRKIPAVDWNEQTKAEEWRAAWAEAVNAAFGRHGLSQRIDHRSYERQGAEQIPTVHLGVATAQMERKGVATNRGNLNRAVTVTNSHLRQLRGRIVKLQSWLKAAAANTAAPTLADVVRGILARREQRPGRHQQALSPENAAKVLNFLAANSIMDMAGLEKKVKSMYAGQGTIREELKPVERAGLDAERSRLDGKYASLKDEVKEVELIKWTVYNLMREENRSARIPKVRGGMER